MKTFSLIYKGDKPYLRQNNPLSGTNLISASVNDEHERLYIESALPLVANILPGKDAYYESELKTVWQFRERASMQWEDISEPNFIETLPNQYRQVFKLYEETTFQQKVRSWLVACFSEHYASDIQERNLRFLEEALELVQSLDLSKEEVLRLVVYTYGRPPGQPMQEAGGALVTLSALCSAANIDMQQSGETEINNNICRTTEIRAKHLLKQREGIAK